MLSVKQGGIKYHFKSLWYDSTWDWTQVSRAIGEHSNRWATPVTRQTGVRFPDGEVNIVVIVYYFQIWNKNKPNNTD